MLNNTIYISGGYDNDNAYKDVWSSADGISWKREIASAAFGAESNHLALVQGDKIFIIGIDSVGLGRTILWSSRNGKSWTRESETDQFRPGIYRSGVVFRR